MARLTAEQWEQARAAGLLLEDRASGPAPKYLPPGARKALGHTEPPRPAHVAQMEYDNAGGW